MQPSDRYSQSLKQKKHDNHYRSLSVSANDMDLYSNDYLGFARDTEFSNLIQEEMHLLGHGKIGSTGSRLISGNYAYLESVEKYIAAFHGFETALLYSTGYMANLGVVSCIARSSDVLLVDELCHASIVDGARLSKARKVIFKHNDILDFREKIIEQKANVIVVLESIFSMNGNVCKLEEILDICKAYNAKIIVDEAHAIGTIGQEGRGLVNKLGFQDEVLACMVTYGKAMGAQGAAVLCAHHIRDYLINYSRTFIFSTGPSYPHVASIKCAYDLLKKKGHRIKKLRSVIDYFIRRRKQDKSSKWLISNTQIQSLIIPGNEKVIAVAEYLNDHGILIKPIRHPSVPTGTERIRICLHSHNTKNEIDHFFTTLRSWHTSK